MRAPYTYDKAKKKTIPSKRQRTKETEEIKTGRRPEKKFKYIIQEFVCCRVSHLESESLNTVGVCGLESIFDYFFYSRYLLRMLHVLDFK